MDEKQCGRCMAIKPLSAFSRDRTRRDGLARRCKQCYSDYNKYGQATRKKRVVRPTPPEGYKWCTTCGEAKPFASFSANRSKKGGSNGRCKKCKSTSDHRYREANSDKLNAHNRLYQRINKSHLSIKKREYYVKHRESIKAKVRAYKEANRERALQAVRDWYSRNRAHQREVNRTYRAAHRDEHNAYRRLRYQNSAAYKATKEAYVQQNRERVRVWAAVSNQKRGLRKKLAEGRFTTQDIIAIHAAQNGLCDYCQRPLESFHIEHKTPLSRGGTNWPHNLCLSCPRCNLRKHTLTAEEFRLRLAEEAGTPASQQSR